MVTGVIKTKLQIYKKAINCILELKKSNVNAAVHVMTLIRMSLRQVTLEDLHMHKFIRFLYLRHLF